ncbi:MAG: SPFH domain-containing protein [Clostridiales bacterium]|nr:SPFH domain-containing protein [Clostridiales bacterium]
MGLIKLIGNIASTVGGSISSQFADQYLEFFTTDALGQDVLCRKGANKITKGNNKGNTDVISNGSKIVVPPNHALILVNNGQVVDYVADGEGGMYSFDSSTAPSCLANEHFFQNLKASVVDTWNRMRAGGEIMQEQLVYYVNMQEIRDQKFGTSSPVPYPDPVYRNIYIKLNGSFTFKIADPITFWRNVCSNISGEYRTIDLMGTPKDPKQPRLEFLDLMTEALNLCGTVDKIEFAQLPGNKTKLRENMQTVLDEKWLKGRGMVVEEVALGIPQPDEKSRERIETYDNAAVFAKNPNAVATQAILGQTDAMKTAAGNANGAVNGFMGMGMVGGMGGMGAMSNGAFNMLQNNGQQGGGAMGGAVVGGGTPPTAPQGGWTCECGAVNQGKFCGTCGKPQPAPAGTWTCECGASNTGKFCSNCGKPQPVVNSGEWTCECGAKNTGKFCSNCGKPQA